jgi:hypothetical protein
MILERVCRIGAILIAVLAVVDPAWVMARSARPRVVITQTTGATMGDVERVRDVLGDAFEIERETSPTTAVRVVVGRTPPTQPADDLTFVVAPAPAVDAPEIRHVEVGDETSVDAIGRVTIDLALPGSADAREVVLALTADDVPLDTQTRTVPPGTSTLSAELSFVPARLGLAHLRVTARLGDGPVATADVATEVTRRTLRVLSYEARPSWAATFVRRSLEEDPRFEVVVRSMTSRGVAADAGAPPATLDRAEDLADFDLVVVSTPDALGDRAAAALENYLRTREGAVVLLPAEAGSSVATRLTGVANWTVDRRPALATVEASVGSWTASEFLWPAALPAGAEALTGCLSPSRCAVWRVPVGGGRVVVSSALDGWRTRGAEGSTFDAFWRTVVGDEASATPPPVDVVLTSRLVTPNTIVSAHVQVMPAVAATAAPTAEWQNTEGRVEPVRLWSAADGGYRAEFRAPDVPGRYRLVVKPAGAAASEARAEFLVLEAGQIQAPLPDGLTLLSAFVSSRGGALVPMQEVDGLPARITAAIPSSSSDTPTNPMRSPFWIIPFAGLLAVEWWSRRRRGAR